MTGQSFGFAEKDAPTCKVINVACTDDSSMKSINQVIVAEKKPVPGNDKVRPSGNDKVKLVSLSMSDRMENALFSKMQPRPPLITDYFPTELKMPPHLAVDLPSQKTGLSVVD